MQIAPVQWSFSPDNPVIRPGQLGGALDARIAGAGSVVQIGDSYRMFYWGSGKHPNCICSAESPVDQPNQWRFLGPVILPEPRTTHNVNGPRWPWAVKLDDKTIFLYYCARGDPALHPYPSSYWLVISEDAGKTWRQGCDAPLFERERPYECEAFGSQCVVRVGRKFHMYYTAFNGYSNCPPGIETHDGQSLPVIGIGLAVSDDGIHWEKPYDHFLIGPRFFATQPFEYKVAKPCVLRVGGLWRMWISSLGRHYRVFSLVSRDAIHWHWQSHGPDGDLGVGPPGSFDSEQRSYPMIVEHGDELRCWYTGNRFGATGMGYATGK